MKFEIVALLLPLFGLVGESATPDHSAMARSESEFRPENSAVERFIRRLPLAIEEEAMREFIGRGFVVDGRAGGLVLGRSHDDGNIFILVVEDGQAKITERPLEGGEFVINSAAYAKNKERIDEINGGLAGYLSDLPPLVITPKFRVLSVAAEPFDKLLWLDVGQFIVKRLTTAKNCEELNRLNLDGNDALACDLEGYFAGKNENGGAS